MKRFLFIYIIFVGMLLHATEYRVTNLKKGGMLNVRDLPLINSRTVVGKIPGDAMGIEIRECRYDDAGREWCYISHLVGAEYLEGWVSRKFLKPMTTEEASSANFAYIKNFLKNYYMAEEKNFLDKLKIFHYFPMQQYMHNKGVTHQALRTTKVGLYKRWPQRTYKLGTVRVLKRQPTYIDVKATVFWRHAKGEEYESGHDVQKIRLVRSDNRLKILAIKRLSHVVNPKPVVVEEKNATLTDLNGSSVPSTGEKYYIKAGSFTETPNAGYLQKISDLGFSYTIETTTQGGKRFNRVYIGPFSTTIDSTNALDAIRQNVNASAYIETRKW
ncbi:MAG TPA: SPOR domain-containing protein [Campylobacterales bacterium]|nr:SPOR domain-containing protein [Campylobacterales bacterium]